MSPARHDGVRAKRIATALALVGIAVLSLLLRHPGVTEGGFGSHDVAGILYEAMVLHDGGLPYVDTIEFKAPGCFWLARWLAGPDGTDIAAFQRWAAAAGIASLLVVGATAWALFGHGSAIAAAGLYGLHDLHLDNIDANYVTWAQLPMVCAAALALLAPRTPAGWGRWLAWGAAGLLAGLTVMCKRQPGLVIVLVATLSLRAVPGRPRRSVFPPLCVALGAAASHAPLLWIYGRAGQLGALWDGYVFPEFGYHYVAARSGLGLTAGLSEGLLATTYFLALPLALAAFAIASAPRCQRRTLTALILWAAVMVGAAAVGLRFYKGYFLAVLPPLCILGAAPWGQLGTRSAAPRWLRAALAAPLLVLVARQAMFVDQLRRSRAKPSDTGGRVIAAHIGPRTEPGDTIWVWGWHLWDVYALTGRRSASVVYKSIALLTRPNDDTWRTAPSKPVFVDGPVARRLMADLQAAPPVWVVLGSTAPSRDFTALTTFLRTHYRRDRRVTLGRVQFWHRTDRARTDAP